MSKAVGGALNRLADAAEVLGYPLSPSGRAVLGKWAKLVVEWREAAQLTGIRTASAVISELMVPAVHALRVVAVLPEMHIVDFGCGNGCTGVALAVVSGQGKWYLLDRDEKKMTFCRYALGRCRIELAAVSSPEGPARGGAQADVVLARAVPRTGNALAEAAGLLREGGVLVRWLPESEAQSLPGAVACGDSGIWVVAQPRQCFT